MQHQMGVLYTCLHGRRNKCTYMHMLHTIIYMFAWVAGRLVQKHTVKEEGSIGKAQGMGRKKKEWYIVVVRHMGWPGSKM